MPFTGVYGGLRGDDPDSRTLPTVFIVFIVFVFITLLVVVVVQHLTLYDYFLIFSDTALKLNVVWGK